MLALKKRKANKNLIKAVKWVCVIILWVWVLVFVDTFSFVFS